jgi:hypothetical protein
MNLFKDIIRVIGWYLRGPIIRLLNASGIAWSVSDDRWVHRIRFVTTDVRWDDDDVIPPDDPKDPDCDNVDDDSPHIINFEWIYNAIHYDDDEQTVAV